MNKLSRSSGVLLHPTSLPSRYGIGDLGASARDFVKALATAKQTWWQLLPLNVPGHGGSPYSAESAFAGNPALIDLDALREEGWVTQETLDRVAGFAAQGREDRVDFGDQINNKYAALEEAWETWRGQGDRKKFEKFTSNEQSWLEDYALYASLKETHDRASWTEWEAPLVAREPEALASAREELADQIEKHSFYQWIFFEQWAELRAFARAAGIKLIGDVPIFVAMDSADAWARRDLFKLDADGHADVVAGVPPDYFSETGQKWGNPVYDWERVAEDDWSWWCDRVKKVCDTVDLIRIDHFRGFQDYWETPAEEETAINGEWVAGPRDHFFKALARKLGTIPFIAEDLGDIDPPVYALRDRHGMPGMKVMHFAFGGEPNHPFLPHTYPTHCVAYTGTHDNDTTRGWFDALSETEKHRVRTYLSAPNERIVYAMLDALFASRANLVIIPAQDLWSLGAEERMNTPGTTEGNWMWRMTHDQLNDSLVWSGFEQLTLTHHPPTS